MTFFWESPARFKNLFLALFCLGLLERLLASYFSNLGIAFADEHQQYLEQAFRQVHGYGFTFWEQSWGMRHLLYSTTLAWLLRGMEFFRIEDAFTQAFLLRLILSETILLLMSLYAWKLHRQGKDSASFFLMFLLVGCVDVVYIQVRLLSENAMTVPLMLALLSEKRWPRLAGLLWMIVFAIRFQSAFLILGLLAWTFWENYRDCRDHGTSKWIAFGPSLKLIQGLAVGSFLVGGMDYWSFGTFFHSPLVYLEANVFMGKSANFGVDPWYYYILHGIFGLMASSVCIAFVLGAAVKLEGRMLWMCALFVLGHSAIGHKEMRFLWSLLPLGLIILASGFEELVRLSKVPERRVLLFQNPNIILGTFLLSSLLRGPFIPWTNEPYRSTCLALQWLHDQPDVTGIAGLGMDDGEGGNRFFLRRPDSEVGLFHYNEGPLLWFKPEFVQGKYNYLMVWEKEINELEGLPLDLEEVKTIGSMKIFKLRSPPGPMDLDYFQSEMKKRKDAKEAKKQKE